MTPADTPEGMRLNRWFSDHGICSRREADRWITAGRVRVNGQLAELGTRVGPKDTVALDDRRLDPRRPRPVVIAYNKPVGIECTADPDIPNNVIAAVNYPERLIHIGRLDVMSEGLLLLTNRGELVDRLLRPGPGHEREYKVELSHPIGDDAIARLARGVELDEDRGPRMTRPCTVERLGPASIRMILAEGRNRQIRRMAEAVGNHVRRLERVRIMHIQLGNLRRGAWRPLAPRELKELFATAGLQPPKAPGRVKRPGGPGGPRRRR